jgi:hypothetical protein
MVRGHHGADLDAIRQSRGRHDTGVEFGVIVSKISTSKGDHGPVRGNAGAHHT